LSITVNFQFIISSSPYSHHHLFHIYHTKLCGDLLIREIVISGRKRCWRGRWGPCWWGAVLGRRRSWSGGERRQRQWDQWSVRRQHHRRRSMASHERFVCHTSRRLGKPVTLPNAAAAGFPVTPPVDHLVRCWHCHIDCSQPPPVEISGVISRAPTGPSNSMKVVELFYFSISRPGSPSKEP